MDYLLGLPKPDVSDSVWKKVDLTSAMSITIIGIGLYLLYLVTIKPFLSPLRQMPGTSYYPLVGNMKELMQGESMETSLKYFNEYGLTLRYYFFFGSERVMTADPDALKHILVSNCKNYIKPPGRIKLMRKFLGDGLIMLEGDAHAAHRKLMGPSFTPKSIRRLVGVYEFFALKLVVRWKQEIQQFSETTEAVTLAVHEDLARMTLDIIGKTAFNYDFGSLDNPDHPVSMAFHRVLAGSGLNWKMAIPFYDKLPFPEIRQLNLDMDLMQRVINGIVKKKRGLVQCAEDAKYHDLLSRMMKAKDETTGIGLSDSELRDEVMTLMAAGHETTAVAMSWCLLKLAENPEVQNKAREEIFKVVPQDGSFLTYDLLEEMPYLECVIKETLRLYPPVTMTLRQSLQDDVLGKYFIPKGTIILLSMGAMMRLEQFFPDPKKFNPERWMDEEVNKSAYKFLPFLIGPRQCIGYKFALMEMKAVLVTILRNIKFTTIPGKKFRRLQRITMRPNPPLVLHGQVCKRSQQPSKAQPEVSSL